MSLPGTFPTAPSDVAHGRAPAALVTATVLVGLIALVGCYGAFYFSFVADDPEVTIGGIAFVAAYWAVAITGAAGVVAALARRAAGRRAAMAFAVAGVLFTVAKLVFWQETEAVAFGVVDLVVLLLLTRPSVRRHVGLG